MVWLCVRDTQHSFEGPLFSQGYHGATYLLKWHHHTQVKYLNIRFFIYNYTTRPAIILNYIRNDLMTLLRARTVWICQRVASQRL